MSYNYASYGDPAKTRMKVISDRGKWRVFELAQPGTRCSRHGDLYFPSWIEAMNYANRVVIADRRYARILHIKK